MAFMQVNIVGISVADENIDINVINQQSNNEKINGIPFKTEGAITSGYIVRIIVSLVIVLAIALGVTFALRKYAHMGVSSGSKNDNYLELLDVKKISSKTTLLVVKVDDKKITLAQSGDSIVVIDKESTGDSQNNISK